MKSSINQVRREIALATRSSRIISVWRERIDRYEITGYVVEASADFLVVHCMNDGIHLDGHALIRVADITNIDRSPERADFYEKALKFRHERPKKPKSLRLENMHSILHSLNDNYPLVAVEREKVQNDECVVGTIHMMTESTVIFKWLTPDAKWDGNTPRYRLADITKIEFDNSYLNALTMVIRASPTKRK